MSRDAVSPIHKGGAAIHLDYMDTATASSSSSDHRGDLKQTETYQDPTADSHPNRPRAVLVTPELVGQLVYLTDPSRQPNEPYAEHGPLVDGEGPQADLKDARPELAWSRIRHYMREPFAEFFGTFVMIMFGDGVVAQVVLSGSKNGAYMSISFCWGLGRQSLNSVDLLVMLTTVQLSCSVSIPVVSQELTSTPPSLSRIACTANSHGGNFQSTWSLKFLEPCAHPVWSTPTTKAQLMYLREVEASEQ
jgi:hypothetical protein